MKTPSHYIATAKLHEQPPFETAAVSYRRTRQFEAEATLGDVYQWVQSLASSSTYLVSIKISHDEGSGWIES